jgi:glycosyltransferase involved in cell wall biosynthesis
LLLLFALSGFRRCQRKGQTVLSWVAQELFRSITSRPDARVDLGLPQNRMVVLMVSTFVGTKRVLDGIRALAWLKEAVLVVAGNDPLRELGERRAAELLLDHCQRLALSADQIPNLYRSGYVFRHLSQVESVGSEYRDFLRRTLTNPALS